MGMPGRAVWLVTILLLLLPFGHARWPTWKVLVPAVYKEWQAGPPSWVRNTSAHSVFLYQRYNPRAPNFAYNFGTEGGVFLRFIVDFYHDLPDVTVFLHGGNPADHNPRVWDLVRCLRPDATFVPLNDVFVHNRSVAEFSFYGWSVWLEQCWRDFLAAFNVTFPPRQRVGVSFTCCSQFAVSRRTLRRHSLETYRRALRIAGEPPEVCHEGPADRRALWATRLPGQKLWRERPLHHGRHTAGLAFEHLNHIVLGGQPFHARPYTQVSLCQQFLPANECPGSPCGGSWRQRETNRTS
jgi:hypothetical protein